MNTFLLDTDIGTDVDDALAVSWMLNNKNKNILGIIVTNGPTKTRANIVKTILKLKGASRIPVFRGKSQSSTKNRIPFVTGNEEIGIEHTSHAFPLKTLAPILSSQPDSSVTYILIAPATSCCTILNSPEIRKKIRSIVIMGGVISGDTALPNHEHNISADPVAFSKICSFRIPLYIIPLNVTLRYVLSENDISRISMSHTPLSQKMSLWIHAWRTFTRTFSEENHWFRNTIRLHDPLTCLAATNKSLYRWKTTGVSVSENGVLRCGEGKVMHLALSLKHHGIVRLTEQIVSSIVGSINMI